MKKQINIKNLTVSYDRKPVIWDLDFSIPRQSCVGIIGPNGAGKTTLVKTMIGLLEPLSGEIDFFGKDNVEMKGKIGYVPQRKSIDWDFPITVFEVVQMGLYSTLGLFKRPSRREKERVLEVLKSLKMDQFADCHIGDLSGGQQQRLFVARALLQDADVFFFDEPFVCIDKTTEQLIIDIFKQLVSEGKTLFVVHHDLNTVKNYFDTVVMLNTRLIAAGPVEKVYTMENLTKTFGQGGLIFEEALNLTSKSQEGLKYNE